MASGPSTCDATSAYTLGSSVQGTLVSGDCKADGDPADYYQIVVGANQPFRVTVTASGFSAMMSIARAPGTGVDDEVAFAEPAKASFALPAGTYILVVTGVNGGKGSYTFASTALTPPEPSGCGDAAGTPFFAAANVIVSGTFSASDCKASNGSPYDPYRMRLIAGKTYVFNAIGSLPRLNLEVARNGAVLTGQSSVTGKVTITYTPTQTDYYGIGAFAPPAGTTGAYTFSATVP